MKKELTVIMNKNVTIFYQVGRFIEAVTLRYKDLPEALKQREHDEIVVKYQYGDEKRRVKLLEELGYQLKENIFYNTDAPYAPVKQIWVKAKPTTKKKATTKTKTTKKATTKKTAKKK